MGRVIFHIDRNNSFGSRYKKVKNCKRLLEESFNIFLLVRYIRTKVIQSFSISLFMQRILLVCLGNICRSPMAEGILAHLVKERGLIQSIELDSAGTGAYHIGSGPDKRALEVCLSNGITLQHQARQVKRIDFDAFDYILAMDAANYDALKTIAPHDQLYLMRSFDPSAVHDLDVPDPYYGGIEGFNEVYEMLYRAANGLLDHIQKK